MWKLLLILATSASIAALVSGHVARGPLYQSYLCAAHKNISSGFFSCNEDCVLSHGSAGGSCLDPLRIGRYNCICGATTGQQAGHGRQCVLDNAGYRGLCAVDCRCNHGAHTGHCNFHTNACICEGYNPTNDGCNAINFEDFRTKLQVLFRQTTGTHGPDWLFHRF